MSMRNAFQLNHSVYKMGAASSQVRPLLQITRDCVFLDVVKDSAVLRLQKPTTEPTEPAETARRLGLLASTRGFSEFIESFPGEVYVTLEPGSWRLEVGTADASTTLSLSFDDAERIMNYITDECELIIVAGETDEAESATADEADKTGEEGHAPDDGSADLRMPTFQPHCFVLPFSESKWDEYYCRLRDHARETGTLADMDADVFAWCRQQVDYPVSDQKRDLLDMIPGWDWCLPAGGATELRPENEDEWLGYYFKVCDHACNTKSLAGMRADLYCWCRKQHAFPLSLNRKRLLQKIPGWDWNAPAGGATMDAAERATMDAAVPDTVDAAAPAAADAHCMTPQSEDAKIGWCTFYTRMHNYACTSMRQDDVMDPDLYNWCEEQVQSVDTLSDRQKVLLQKIPGWDWNTFACAAAGVTMFPTEPATTDAAVPATMDAAVPATMDANMGAAEPATVGAAEPATVDAAEPVAEPAAEPAAEPVAGDARLIRAAAVAVVLAADP